MKTNLMECLILIPTFLLCFFLYETEHIKIGYWDLNKTFAVLIPFWVGIYWGNRK